MRSRLDSSALSRRPVPLLWEPRSGASLWGRALGLRRGSLGVLTVLQPSAQPADHEATSSLPAHMLFQKHLQLVCAAFLRMCHVSGQCWGKLGCFFFFPQKQLQQGFLSL